MCLCKTRALAGGPPHPPPRPPLFIDLRNEFTLFVGSNNNKSWIYISGSWIYFNLLLYLYII
ncbi:hypothetical protein HanIR_Chr09g0401181 [Helianthus annuus]|nr:hypothetical protein HanIR_Chr09g0401181 [Helianthus annuus]